MLLFCVLGTLPLEPALGVGVYRRLRRLALTLLPVVPVFVAWDLYAVAQGHWSFDRSQLLGVTLPGGLPVEEVAFFVVVPLAAVLTLEAVRAARGWSVGDEAECAAARATGEQLPASRLSPSDERSPEAAAAEGNPLPTRGPSQPPPAR